MEIIALNFILFMKLYSVLYNLHVCSSSGVSSPPEKKPSVYHSGTQSVKHCSSFKEVATHRKNFLQRITDNKDI